MNKAALACLALGGLLASGCAARRELKNLDPDSREFLSTVRYLIGKEERRAFLALTA